MQVRVGAWPLFTARGKTALPVADIADILVTLALVWAAVALFWTLVRPMGPVGRWQAVGSGVSVADPLILTRFDPFFRNVASGPAAVTALPLKLFGTRLDQAMGRGSAIIATPDGLQNSYAVGDEIVPGVKLKSVAFDNVTIDRGGSSEQLFLDQSVAAAIPAVAGLAGAVPPPATVLTPQSALAGIQFSPRMEKGSVTGFVVGPKGTGDAFAASGLQQGDVVTQINGVVVRTIDDATRAMSTLPADGRVNFTVDRSGKTVIVAGSAPK